MQSDRRMMDKVARMGDLYDFYGALLTERQREWTALHYLEDLSLAEIAEQFGVSRQAVHDNLKRAEEQLEVYDTVLQLIQAHQRRIQYVSLLRAEWESIADRLPLIQRDRIVQLLDALSSDG